MHDNDSDDRERREFLSRLNELEANPAVGAMADQALKKTEDVVDRLRVAQMMALHAKYAGDKDKVRLIQAMFAKMMMDLDQQELMFAISYLVIDQIETYIENIGGRERFVEYVEGDSPMPCPVHYVVHDDTEIHDPLEVAWNAA